MFFTPLQFLAIEGFHGDNQSYSTGHWQEETYVVPESHMLKAWRRRYCFILAGSLEVKQLGKSEQVGLLSVFVVLRK